MYMRMTVNGRPHTTLTYRTPSSARSGSPCEPLSSAMAAQPSVTAQKMRCRIGGSYSPLAPIMSMTSEPESDDVMK